MLCTGDLKLSNLMVILRQDDYTKCGGTRLVPVKIRYQCDQLQHLGVKQRTEFLSCWGCTMGSFGWLLTVSGTATVWK